MSKFRNFTDGYRLILLLERSKESGNVKDRKAIKKITRNSEEFENVLIEFLELQKTEYHNYRIYSCVNARNINKAITTFKHLQLDADSYSEKNRNEFYFDVKNRWLSCYMQPQNRIETNFLIDIDTVDEKEIKEYEEQLCQITRNFFRYKTKNGWHIISQPFNPNLLTKYPINKDGLLLLSY
jgi:hypothetical protein